MGDTIVICYLLDVMRNLADRLTTAAGDLPDHRRGRGDLGSMTTEMVIIIAGLAALAITILAILSTKVTMKASGIAV